ncbi:MAG: hypothetical protein R6U19_03080 [Bacteroidales bacterium]
MGKSLKTETSYKTDYRINEDTEEPQALNTIKTSYREFDEQGNILLDEVYMEDGSFDRRYVCRYEDNKLLDEKLYITDPSELSEHNSFEYEGDKIIKAYTHFQDGSRDTILYDYDPQGHLIKKTIIDEDEEIEEVEERIYDQQNLISLYRYEDGDMEHPSLEEHNEFDEQGNLIEKIVHDHKDEQKEKQVFEYDDQGKETMIKNYRNDLLQQKAIFHRDENGNPTEIIEEKPGQRIRIVQQHDANGNVTGQTVYNTQDTVLYKIRRKFDEHNNMLESVVQKDELGTGYFQMYKISIHPEYY